uniref:Uncharacterized protein n=1 Tax=Nelumbo nucifera TaxID=4432 RepID=A0A822XY65_NELNU|nr:TPA_asm: hypothetical protein HUJ06_026117 [Nelumbo nucifera]
MLELKKTDSSILVSKKWERKKTKDLVDEKNPGDEVACKKEKNPSMAEVPESDQAKNLGLGKEQFQGENNGQDLLSSGNF